ANIQSMEEMIEYIQSDNISLNEVPIVLQYNKRDLIDALDIEILQNDLNRNNWDYVPATASAGKGVLETLYLILKITLKRVKAKVV
ncbi:MAG: GTPase domain-containing protein, partial [candidate division WOR-3 bacterium]